MTNTALPRRLLLLLTLALLWLVPAAAVAGRELREERLAVFDDVWQTIESNYYDPSHNGVNWESIGATFRPLAREARSEAELYHILRRMIARLDDPHTRIYAPGERPDGHRPRHLTIGVRVREIDGEIIVVEVERGGDADRQAGVRAGDAVIQIDGRPAIEVFANRLAEQSNAAAARASAEARIFEGPPDSFVSVVFKGIGAREKRARLRRVLRAAVPTLTARRIDGYGVIRFTAFEPEIAAEFGRVLKGPMRAARGIVLDLRGNGGGELEAMIDIASFFLPRGKKLGQFTDRGGRVYLEPQTRGVMLSSADAIMTYGGPLVILTSVRTASASEVFAAALRAEARAIVIGEGTCGCVLGIRRRHLLPDGGLLEVSEVDYRAASGMRLEGVGIAPDDEVALTRRDLRDERDAALERAIKLLKATPKDGAAGAAHRPPQ